MSRRWGAALAAGVFATTVVGISAPAGAATYPAGCKVVRTSTTATSLCPSNKHQVIIHCLRPDGATVDKWVGSIALPGQRSAKSCQWGAVFKVDVKVY